MINYTTKLNTTTAEGFKTCDEITFKNMIQNKYEDENKKGGIYEITPNETPIKLYLDIDIDNKTIPDIDINVDKYFNDEYLNKICQGDNFDSQAINIIYLNLHGDTPDITILSSHSKSYIDWKSKKSVAKISFHIIVNNYIATKQNIQILVEKMNETLKKDGCVWKFDTSVYSTNRKMRCLNSSKPEEKRYLILEYGTIEGSIISGFIPKNAENIDDQISKYNKFKNVAVKVEDNETDNEDLSTISNVSRAVANDIKDEPIEDKFNEVKLFIETGIKYNIFQKMSGAGSYSKWINIGYLIANNFKDNGEDLFNELSKNDVKYNEYEVRIQYRNILKQMKEIPNDKKINIGTLIKYFKETDEELANTIIKEVKNITNNGCLYKADESIEINDELYISSNDLFDNYKIATTIQNTLRNKLVYCNDKWFIINDKNLWIQIKDPSFCIINEVRQYIDESNKKIVIQIAQTEGESKDKLIEISKLYLKSYKVISSSGVISVLTKYMKSLIYDADFEQKLNNNNGKLAFINGIVDLETKTFRDGIRPDDFITETIPYKYESHVDETKYKYVKAILKKILNNNDEHLEYYLSIIGYTFIGKANLEKSIYFCIDKTIKSAGDNGKTFYFDILTFLMPNYVYKSKGSLLEEGNTKVHKQLAMMKGKRLVWLDEFGKKKANGELIKELGDGLTTENEVMYGTSENINISFKTFILTNHIPVIDVKDTAIYNRFKQISYGSHFDRTGTRKEEKPEELLFVADTSLGDKIKTEYYDVVFHLIVDYAHQYYERGMKMKKIPDEFVRDAVETQLTNDKFGLWFNENCVIDANEKVAHIVLLTQCCFTEKDTRDGLARLGFKYDKELKGIGKNDKGIYYKGGYRGFKYVEKMAS